MFPLIATTWQIKPKINYSMEKIYNHKDKCSFGVHYSMDRFILHKFGVQYSRHHIILGSFHSLTHTCLLSIFMPRPIMLQSSYNSNNTASVYF